MFEIKRKKKKKNAQLFSYDCALKKNLIQSSSQKRLRYHTNVHTR